MASFHLNAWPLGELGSIEWTLVYGTIFRLILLKIENLFTV